MEDKKNTHTHIHNTTKTQETKKVIAWRRTGWARNVVARVVREKEKETYHYLLFRT